MYVEIAFGSVQVRVRDHDLGSKSKQAETFRSLWLSSESVGVGVGVDGVAGRVEFAFKLFTVRRVSGGPNKHMLAPHRAIPIPLIPCIPPGVVGVGLVLALALLDTYGSHTSAGPLTDIAASCATDIIGTGVGTRVLVKLAWSRLL